MSYSVYWEGRKRFHRKSYATKARAVSVAARASRMTKGFVIVERNGREIEECYKGKCHRSHER